MLVPPCVLNKFTFLDKSKSFLFTPQLFYSIFANIWNRDKYGVKYMPFFLDEEPR